MLPIRQLPNALSQSRLALAPTGLVFAWMGEDRAYQLVFAVAVTTDFLDGWLARRWGVETARGARLDALADMATYLALFFAVVWLWPDFIADRFWLLVGGFAIYVPGYVYGFGKYGRLPAYHSWGGKVSAVGLAAGMLLWFAGGPQWPFTVALTFALCSGVEQIGMTALLPTWRSPVPTLAHAWRWRRAGSEAA
jgi:phosphatidylglycerophosphate synthase